MQKYLKKIMEHFGIIEVAIRLVCFRYPDIKKILKTVYHKEGCPQKLIDNAGWKRYKDKIMEIAGENKILLIHSSMDGLKGLGVTIDDFLNLLLELVALENTVVIPAFPVLLEKGRPYNPQKTICWTGMIPNAFLRMDGVIRSAFPYNSLAAAGQKAQEMMKDNMQSAYVYKEGSAWNYCVKNEAKILFLGITAAEANTIAIHMAPDVMEGKWPVENWYEKRAYEVLIDDKKITKEIFVQKDCWYNYCMENKTSFRLKKMGILKEVYIGGSYLGYVMNSKEMLTAIVQLCERGKLMYLIPKKHCGGNI